MPTDEHDREQQFERALARHLRNASPDSACPDAETLAAYHERSLSLEEMARWKEHIAACQGCQQRLALVEETENLPAEEWEQQNVPAPVELGAGPKAMGARGASVREDEQVLPAAAGARVAPPMDKISVRPPWRWIVPVGALAAGVIVWIGVQEIRTQHQAQRTAVEVAQNRAEAPEPPPAASSETADQRKKAEPPGRKLDQETGDQKTVLPAPTKPVSPQRVESAESLNAPPAPSFQNAFNSQKDLENAAVPKASAAQPAPPSHPGVAKSRAREILSLAPPAANAPAGVAGGVLAGAAPGNAPAEEKQKEVPAVAQTVTVESSASPADTISSSTSVLTTSSTNLPLNVGKTTNLVQMAVTDHRVIVAPSEKYAWLVGDTGKIEHSTDGGKTWKPQKSGVAADLMAGSAPADKICWVVGKAGIVLLTTDGGKHWKPIPAPITEDLGGIQATDRLHASIWDVPNRRSYQTKDGGATWSQTSTK